MTLQWNLYEPLGLAPVEAAPETAAPETAAPELDVVATLAPHDDAQGDLFSPDAVERREIEALILACRFGEALAIRYQFHVPEPWLRPLADCRTWRTHRAALRAAWLAARGRASEGRQRMIAEALLTGG